MDEERNDFTKDPSIQKMLHEYTQAIEQEWEESNPSVTDTPEELATKARSLVISNLPTLLGKATGLALTANSESTSLSAIKFLYSIIVPPSTTMPGEPDPISKLLADLSKNDPPEVQS